MKKLILFGLLFICLLGHTQRQQVSLIHDQNMWTHSNAVVDEMIGTIYLNADSLRTSPTESTIVGDVIYSISVNPDNLFKLDGNVLEFASVSGLQSHHNYEIVVQAKNQNYVDNATMTVRCVGSDSIIYRAYDGSPAGVGSWGDPFSNMTTSLPSYYYTFLKRGGEIPGTYYGTINFGYKTRLVAYGNGTRPEFTVANGDGDDYCIHISTGDDYCVMHGININVLNTIPANWTSRLVQITQAYGVEISDCQIDSGYHHIYVQHNNVSGECENLRIVDNRLSYAGDDPIVSQSRYSSIVGNVIKYFSIHTTGGDAIHTTRSADTYVAHNWIFSGDSTSTKQGILLNANVLGSVSEYNPDAPYGYQNNAICEHNTLWLKDWNGILSGGTGNIIRSNFIYRDNSVDQDNTGVSIRYGGECLVYNNYIHGFEHGIDIRNDTNLIYNNIFDDCSIIIDGVPGHLNDPVEEPFGEMGARVYNNIYIDTRDYFYDIDEEDDGSHPNVYDFDYNITTDDLPSNVDGASYDDLADLVSAGFETNSSIATPDLTTLNKPVSNGNLINEGISLASYDYDLWDLGYDFLKVSRDGYPDLGILEDVIDNDPFISQMLWVPGFVLTDTTPVVDSPPAFDDDLFLWLTMNGDVSDTTGNFTPVNSGTVTADDKDGISNKAIQFDGTDYVTLDDALTDSIVDEFSISLWFKFTTIPSVKEGREHLIGGRGFQASPYGFGVSIAVYTNDVMYFDIYSSSQRSWCSYGTSWGTSNWYHVVGTYAGVNGSNSDQKLYINGAEVDGAGTSTLTSAIDWSSMDFDALGAMGITAGGEKFIGNMDDVRVYSRELSSAEVTNLYSSGPR